ncbi:hypothetical protein MLD38_035916 [Melastoma candidum]|uniref:Uncharacterized protein n=1 Tax=Melastoma candidum TaxID=119954 RepID=A0ACB9LJ95_9MYRT|nr:hypothetical protein MLD38_035916 [Melastoma candidum]
MEKVAMKKPKLQPPSLGIFWDTISCPIPDGVNPGDVLDNIIAALRVHFPDHDLGAFFVYGVDSKTRPLRPREGDGAKLRVVDGAYSLYQQIHRDAALVLPLSDPAARGYCEFPDFLLLDWLWVSRGSGKIITMDDFGSVAATAPVAGDAEAVEGHCGSGLHIQRIKGVEIGHGATPFTPWIPLSTSRRETREGYCGSFHRAVVKQSWVPLEESFLYLVALNCEKIVGLEDPLKPFPGRSPRPWRSCRPESGSWSTDIAGPGSRAEMYGCHRVEDSGKLGEELRRADAVVLTYPREQPETLHRLSTFWLPELKRLCLCEPVSVN